MKQYVARIREDLETKITNHKAVIGVIGLGYVGLPLVLRFDYDIIRTDARLIVDSRGVYRGTYTNIIHA